MTARTAAIIFLLFLASLAIQGSVLAMAAPGGVHPDILLVVTVALSALAGPRRGAITGLCAGLMQDILFGSPLGFFAVVKMLAGAAAGLFAEYIYKDVVLVLMLMMGVLTFFSDAATFLMLDAFGFSRPPSLVGYLQQATFIRAAINFFLMGAIYPYLYRAQKRHLLFTNYPRTEE